MLGQIIAPSTHPVVYPPALIFTNKNNKHGSPPKVAAQKRDLGSPTSNAIRILLRLIFAISGRAVSLRQDIANVRQEIVHVRQELVTIITASYIQFDLF